MMVDEGEARKKYSNKLCRPSNLVFDVVFDDFLYRSLFRYFNTLGQSVQWFYTRTRQKYGLKAEQPNFVCVCALFIYLFFILGSTF